VGRIRNESGIWRIGHRFSVELASPKWCCPDDIVLTRGPAEIDMRGLQLLPTVAHLQSRHVDSSPGRCPSRALKANHAVPHHLQCKMMNNRHYSRNDRTEAGAPRSGFNAAMLPTPTQARSRGNDTEIVRLTREPRVLIASQAGGASPWIEHNVCGVQEHRVDESLPNMLLRSNIRWPVKEPDDQVSGEWFRRYPPWLR
jgi:hypothetical protein